MQRGMQYNKTSILFGFTRKKMAAPVKHQLGKRFKHKKNMFE